MRTTTKLLGVILLVAALTFGYACGSTTSNTTATSVSASTSATLGAGSSSAPDATAAPGSASLPDQTNETAGGDVGSARDNPVPLGQEAQIGDWKTKVLSATLNANDVVAGQNEFNNPPEAENQYVLVKVQATRTGEEPAAFLPDIYCAFVGSGGTTFETALADVPDNMSKAAEASQGASISGNLVFQVTSGQVSGGVLMMEQALSYQVTRLHFALQYAADARAPSDN